jgi:hypothetical protein
MNPSSIRVSDHLAFLMLALQDDLDEGTVVRVVSHAILSIKFRLLSINRPRLTVKVNETLIPSRAWFGISICDVEDYLWSAANTNPWSYLTTELFLPDLFGTFDTTGGVFLQKQKIGRTSALRTEIAPARDRSEGMEAGFREDNRSWEQESAER